MSDRVATTLAWWRGLAALVLIAAGPMPARAQAAVPTAAGREGLALRGSLAADVDSGGREAFGAPGRWIPYGTYAGDVEYRREGRRLGFDAAGSASGRYDGTRGEFTNVDYRGRAVFSWALGRKAAISVEQGVSHSSSRFFHLLPIVLPSADSTIGMPPSANHDLTSGYALDTYEATASVGYALTRGISVQAGTSVQLTRSAAPDPQRWRSRTMRVGYRQQVTRNAALRLDYASRRGAYGLSVGGSDAIAHDLDVGIEYSRPLSLTRRTSVSFGTGSSLVERVEQHTGNGQPREVRINGNAQLTHRMRRTWMAQVGYQRGLSFVEGLAAPVGSDGVTASLSGRVTARVDAVASAGASVGVVGHSDRFDMYTGSATARFAVTRSIAAYGSYSYYHYDLGQAIAALSRTLPFFGGHRVQVGVEFQTQRTRR